MLIEPGLDKMQHTLIGNHAFLRVLRSRKKIAFGVSFRIRPLNRYHATVRIAFLRWFVFDHKRSIAQNPRDSVPLFLHNLIGFVPSTDINIDVPANVEVISLNIRLVPVSGIHCSEYFGQKIPAFTVEVLSEPVRVNV